MFGVDLPHESKSGSSSEFRFVLYLKTPAVHSGPVGWGLRNVVQCAVRVNVLLPDLHYRVSKLLSHRAAYLLVPFRHLLPSLHYLHPSRAPSSRPSSSRPLISPPGL
ncbi:hypothetical protein E2C01_018953 [Portunus trituberculatus]|uniref:Uncharacterized protein n=1 Tax=Portunus trituberculatus TaxID=210409 RepID=A0A5B7DWE5_PORTR|nr:hypothetical protein [Portunus trituberculatus]